MTRTRMRRRWTKSSSPLAQTGRLPRSFRRARKACHAGKKKTAEHIHRARNRVSRPAIAENMDELEEKFKKVEERHRVLEGHWRLRLPWQRHDLDPLGFWSPMTLCRCSTTFPVTVKAMKRMCGLVLDSGHLLVQVPKRICIPWKRIAPKKFAESGCPIFRATTPLTHFTADYPTNEIVFRMIVSANQLSLHGTVANMCEEFDPSR